MLSSHKKPLAPVAMPTTTAKSLAVILEEEFATPFTLFDIASGQFIEGLAGAKRHLSKPTSFAPRATSLPDGYFEVLVPYEDSTGPVLAGIGYLKGLADEPFDRAQEQARLVKWVRSVSERLRQQTMLTSKQAHAAAANAHGAHAWEALLTLDKLLHRVRIHKEPLKYQRRILDSAAELLHLQTLIWVAPKGQSPVIAGDVILSPWDCQQLANHLSKASGWDEAGVFICNDALEQTWVKRCPLIRNLMALTIHDQRLGGWLVAINKQPPAKLKPHRDERPTRDEFSVEDSIDEPREMLPFRRGDAAVLAPFVSLLGHYTNSAQRFHDARDLLVGLARALTSSIDAKDPYTYGHSERVARISVELARELGMPDEELNDIYLAGMLHDIGKIGIPDAVLCKPGALTPEEQEVIKQHVTIGHRILSGLKPIAHLLPGVLYHHEHFNGAGYPEGLKGEAIPMLARIISVADSYDAMSSSRPYRTGMPNAKVEEILSGGSGEQWDPEVIAAFKRCAPRVHSIRQRGIGESLRQALDGALRQNDGLDNESLNVPLTFQHP